MFTIYLVVILLMLYPIMWYYTNFEEIADKVENLIKKFLHRLKKKN